jgi:hypothetical protein
MYKALDMYAVGGDTDWSAEFLKLYGGIKLRAEKAEKEQLAKRVLNTKPSLGLEAYVGHYDDPLYGALDISLLNGVLQASNIKLGKGSLTHFNFDTFNIEWDNKWQGKSMVQFMMNTTGKIDKIDLDGIQLSKN